MQVQGQALRAPGPTAQSWRRDVPSIERQRELLRQFQASAARDDTFEFLLDDACLVAAEGVNACWARLLRFSADHGALMLQSGVGWHAFRPQRPGVAGCPGSGAASAWEHVRPERSLSRVVERRFHVSGAWVEFTVFRTACVPVQRDAKWPFGVIEVASADAAAFLDQDIAFLQALADSLAGHLPRPAKRARRVTPSWAPSWALVRGAAAPAGPAARPC